MDVATEVVQFLHTVSAVAWLGGSMFANLVLVPFVVRQPAGEQRALVRSVLAGPERLIIGAALLTVVTGVLRGTAFGRLHSFDALATSYGIAWLLAIAVVVVVFAVGASVTSPPMRRLVSDDSVWTESSASADRERAALMGRVQLGFRLEMTGLLAALALMVVLRFS